MPDKFMRQFVAIVTDEKIYGPFRNRDDALSWADGHTAAFPFSKPFKVIRLYNLDFGYCTSDRADEIGAVLSEDTPL